MRKSWTKEEDAFLFKNYSSREKSFLINTLKRSWSSIQCRSARLKIKKININIKGREVSAWNQEEIYFLKNNYQNTSKKEIMFILNRTWSSIQNKAFLLNIKRNVLNCNIKNLVNKSCESFYWLGFIMADGHFSKGKQIQINLAKKDLNHLQKFANFVEYNNVLTKPSLYVGYGTIETTLNEMLSISNNKTYKPCNLKQLSGKDFFSFIIGFIDGDGSISKRGHLAIKCHKSWQNNIDYMLKFLSEKFYYSCKINSEGLCLGCISNFETMRRVKLKCNELNLPILNRKWDRIQEKKMSKEEKKELNKQKVFKGLSEGLKNCEIIQKYNISLSTIYKYKKTYHDL